MNSHEHKQPTPEYPPCINILSPNEQPSPQALLVSVGGTPDPVLFVLRKYKPRFVCYFCSPNTRPVAEDVQKQLDWHPSPRFIQIERFEELEACYATLRNEIPGVLKEWRLDDDPSQVMVDYTGGTKSMSAALVLAATEQFSNFSYIGGTQREKGGVGITIKGREQALYQGNPWEKLAVRELERAKDMWDHCNFEAAQQIFQDIELKTPRFRFGLFAKLSKALACRHRLDFHKLAREFKELSQVVQSNFDGHPDHVLVELLKSSERICGECASGEANETVLQELIDNALRTEKQHRYEDAAMRLYRAIEMRGQLWLAAMTQQSFKNGICKVSDLPEGLKLWDKLPSVESDGKTRLSLELVFLALQRLGNPHAALIGDDLAKENDSRLRKCTYLRNHSILAHGTKAIGMDGFNTMKLLASELLKFDLSKEKHPIPKFDTRWAIR